MAPNYDPDTSEKKSLGLVLSGGGARGAYQAGVIEALYKIASQQDLVTPFQILTGVSAGAINISFLASGVDSTPESLDRLTSVWSNITSENVFRTDMPSLTAIGWEWIHDIATGRAHDREVPRSLLNTEPLGILLDTKIPFQKIRSNLEKGLIDSVAISAVNYATSEVNVFYQSRVPIEPWLRSD